MLTPEQAIGMARSHKIIRLPNAFRHYEQHLRSCNVPDFDEPNYDNLVVHK